MRSPVPAKSTVWSPTMSPPRMTEKPMRGRVALAGHAVAAVDGAVVQVAAAGAGQHLAHGQRGAAGRVDLVAVVGLDDLDVVALGQRTRRHVEQLEHDVHAQAHVRRHDDGDVPRVLGDLRLLRVAEAGRADDRAHAQLAAHRQVRQRAFGAGEVDQHVGAGQAGMQVGGDAHVAGAAQRQPAGRCPAPGCRPRRARRSGSSRRLADTASTSMRPMRPPAPATAIFSSGRVRSASTVGRRAHDGSSGG